MNLPNIPFKLPSFSAEDLLNVSLTSATGQAILFVAFVFFLLALIAMSRRFLIHHSFKGIAAGIVFGFIIMGLVEAGFVWGVKAINTGENISLLPVSLQTVLSTGQDNLTQVLGAKTERSIPTAQSVVADFEVLPKLDAKLVRDSICRTDNNSSSSSTSLRGEIK